MNMPIAIKELVKLMEGFGFKVSYPKALADKPSLVDELLGEFEGAVPGTKPSSELVKELRESGYGRY